MVTSCAACRNSVTPGTLASCGRSRWMISSADALRSLRGLRLTQNLPLLMDWEPPVTPTQNAAGVRPGQAALFRPAPMKVKRNVQDPALAELFANGIVVLPKYFDGALIKTVHDKALAALEQVRGGGAPKEWNGMRFADDGVYRLLGIEQTVPETAAILTDPRLLTIAKDYLGYPIRETHAYLDYKPDFGKHDETTVPHMDSWMSQIKIFTLLNDIDPLSAPMVYWQRSHRDGEWR